MINKKYIKKVIVTNEDASAEARGERLRKIRNLANLSRKEICDSEDLNLNTYKGWELARFGGLPVDGASRVTQRVAKENVICSVEWLLYGIGQEPYLLPHSNKFNTLDSNTLILKEILVFQSFYPDATFTEIQDDALVPLYMPGDYVAGIKVYGNNISNVINQPCIIGLKNGDVLVRHLRLGQNHNQFQLVASNINSTSINIYSVESELKFAAPIIRHYKTFI